MNNLPPLPNNYTAGDNTTDRPTWEGLPELPPGYRWVAYAQDPAIVNKKKARGPVAWVTSSPEDEKQCMEICIFPTTAPMQCTVVEACHILAAKCWLGEF